MYLNCLFFFTFLFLLCFRSDTEIVGMALETLCNVMSTEPQIQGENQHDNIVVQSLKPCSHGDGSAWGREHVRSDWPCVHTGTRVIRELASFFFGTEKK